MVGMVMNSFLKNIKKLYFRPDIIAVLDFNILSFMHNCKGIFLENGLNYTKKLTCTSKILHAQSKFYMVMSQTSPKKGFIPVPQNCENYTNF